MLQAMRIPISIFHAPIPITAASQIHSDEPQTCAIPRAELATPARSEQGPKRLTHRDAKAYGESGANQSDTNRVTGMGGGEGKGHACRKNSTCEVSIKVRGLNIRSAKGVENETAMLTPAVNAITVRNLRGRNP